MLGPAFMTERRDRSSATCAACTGAAFSGRRAAPGGHRRPSTRTGATSTSCSGLPDHEPAVDRRRISAASASSTSRPGVADGRGVVLALPAPRQLGLRRRLARGRRGTPSPWSPSRSSRPSCSSGSSRRVRDLGMRVIPLGPSAGTDVLAALRANEVVCLLCDRDLTGDGIEVEFFGERTTLPGGPALLALRSGAPLLPAGCYFRATAATRRTSSRRCRRRGGTPPRRRRPGHPGPRAPLRGPHPGRARALAPACSPTGPATAAPTLPRRAPGWDDHAVGREARGLRVMLSCPYSLSLFGGVQGQVLGLARALRALGVDARIVAPCDGPPPEPGHHHRRAEHPVPEQRLGRADRQRPGRRPAHPRGAADVRSPTCSTSTSRCRPGPTTPRSSAPPSPPSARSTPPAPAATAGTRPSGPASSR